MEAQGMRPRLVYFKEKGRAEPLRLAFKLAGLDFEDVRIDFQQFSQLKEKGELPFGSVPLLEVGDFRLSQSNAILRYVGRLGGLYPQEPRACAVVDMVMGVKEDLVNAAAEWLFANSEQRKAAVREKVVSATLPKLLAGLESLLEAAHSPYFVGDQPTIADLAVYGTLGWVCEALQCTQDLGKYPHLKSLMDRVGALPAVKEHEEAAAAE